MRIKGRLAAVAAAVTIAAAPMVVAVHPANAATWSCSWHKVGGNWFGTGAGYWFDCNGSAPATVHVAVTCANAFGSGNQDIVDTHTEIGYPWSFSDSIYCSNIQYVDNPRAY